MPTPPITVHSHWRRKQTPIDVTVTRVTAREVSYITLDKTVSGTVPQWQFLRSFRPVPVRKKKAR